MKHLTHLLFILILTIVPARSAVIIQLYESGDDLVLTANGTIDLTDLTYWLSASSLTRFQGSFGRVTVGPSGYSMFDAYNNATGPANFGSSFVLTPDSGSGDVFGAEDSNIILVPQNYISGATLTASSTYLNTSLADVGLSMGDSFTWTWGSGSTSDSVSLNVVSAVPEPATYAALFGVVGFVASVSRRRALRV